MKRLMIIRHGKAEDPSFSMRDYDRNLVERGREDAKRVANKIRSELGDDIFDSSGEATGTLLISSPANRAIQTAEIMAKEWQIPTERIQQEIQIYEAYHLDILQVINRIPDDVETIIIFGHNPGLSMLVDHLTDQHTELKTANAAYLELDDALSLSELSASNAVLRQIFE